MIIQQIKEKFFEDKTNRSALINLVLKPISLILTIIYTPLLLQYLGDEKYGLWSTVLSIISWINYCDVGIGHGLRNLLAKELTNKQYEEAKKSVSTAYVTLTIIACILLLISVVCAFAINWKLVFNTEVDMSFPLLISFIFICINFILALSNTLLYALQLSERVAIRGCLVQIINIIGILFLKKYTSGSLILISILFGFSTMIIYIWNTIQIFSKEIVLSPTFKMFEKSKIKEISNVGVKFFIIQLDCIALYTVDNIIITHLFGAEAVTPFNITYKIFNTAYGFLAAMIVPYWSKTTIALTEGNFKWLKKSICQLNIVGGIICLGYIIMALVFEPITGLWLGRSLEYPSGLVWVMCIYYCLYSIVTVNIQFINGTGKVNFQLFLLTVMGILNIPLSVCLAKYFGLGVVGVRLATTLLMAIAAIAFPINLYFIVKKSEKDYRKISN